MTMKLYVGNLSFNTSNQDLNDLFGQIGTVESTNIIEDRETGRSRGFAFVEMSSQAEGENAIAQLNGKEVDGRELKVNEAKPQERRGGGGFGGGGGGGRGGNRGGGGGYGGGGYGGGGRY
jgi:RNA recognition motif-containing protein